MLLTITTKQEQPGVLTWPLGTSSVPSAFQSPQRLFQPLPGSLTPPSTLGISHSQFLPSHALHGAFILLPIHLKPPHTVTVEEVKRYVIQDPALHGGFPGGSDIKESTCNAGDLDSIPGLGRSPGEGNGNPLQYSGLVNPMERGD